MLVKLNTIAISSKIGKALHGLVVKYTVVVATKNVTLY